MTNPTSPFFDNFMTTYYILLPSKDYQSTLPHGECLDGLLEFLNFTSKIVFVFKSSYPVVSIGDERLQIIDSCVKWLGDWVSENKEMEEQPSVRNKSIISVKTIFDLYSMLLGFKEVCQNVIANGGMIRPSHFNSDIVENVFCQQRGRHGQNDNPTYMEYASGINSVLLGQTISTTKGNAGNSAPLQVCQFKKLRKA